MKNIFMSKTELAQVYFPLIAPEAARHKLMKLINADKALVMKLKENGYSSRSHCFSPLQIELIMGRYGNPWSTSV